MPYFYSYLATGCLLAIAAGFHSRVGKPQLLIRSVVIIVFWPILVLLSPTFFTRQTPREIIEVKQQKTIFNDFGSLSEADIAALSDEERSRLEYTRQGGEENISFFGDSTNFERVLERLWIDAIPPEAYRKVEAARWKIEHAYQGDEDRILFSRREPDWYVGFSVEFVKSIAKLDKNKRARLLEVVSHLAVAPVTVYGDTVKPLTGDMAGLWRYRLGDDRVIYKPDAQSKKVILISFGARGGIY